MKLPQGELWALSVAQRDIWLDEQRPGASVRYHIGGHVDITGPLDTTAFLQAVRHAIHTHPALRTRLVPDSEGLVPRQCFDTSATPDVAQYDFSGDAANAETAAQRWVTTQFAKPFPPTGPFAEYALLRLGPQRHWWFCKYHHLIVDGWAISLVVQAVERAYTGLADGAAPVMVQAPAFTELLQDELVRRSTPGFATDLAYWRELLAPRHDPLWPARLIRGTLLPGRQSSRSSMTLDQDLYSRLGDTAQAHQVSRFHLLMAALAAAATRGVDATSLMLGLPVLNRANPRDKATVGLMASMQPLPLVLDRSESLPALARRIAAQLRLHYRHRRVSLGDMLGQFPREHFGLQDGTGRATPFDLTLSFEQHDYNVRFGQAQARADATDNGHEPNPLAVFVREFREGADVRVDFDWRHDCFSPADVAALQARFAGLLQALADPAHGAITLRELERPTASERQHLLTLGHRSVLNGPLVHQAVSAAASRTPQAIALRDSTTTLSYAELEQRANRWARVLHTQGVGPESVVAVVLARSTALPVALLAVLKAGGTYLPLDPEEPAARRAAMFAQARVQLVLADAPDAGADAELTTLSPQQLDQLGASLPDTPPAVAVDPRQPAYVLYTSGSTGTPKGVLMPHGALAAHMAWMQADHPLGPDDRVLQKTPVGFDASVWEFWAPLMAGAQLVLAPPGAHREPAVLGQWLAQQAITVLQVTPTLLQALLEAQVLVPGLALRRLFVGGEALPMATVRLACAALPAAQLINLYGPTETCIEVAAWVADVALQGESTAPLGHPVAGARLYVVDRHGALAPVGVPGELWIGGAGLARGYVNQPALTAQRFVPDPFDATPGARVYRSGDRVRWRADGRLDYLGRVDGQLKLRGYRIEPGEVEAALGAHPAVAQAAVAVRELAGAPALVGYVVGAGPQRPEAAALREWLLARLPTYFVPSQLVWLDALPLTNSGKLDRNALPQPEAPTGERTLPRSPTEIALAAIWQDILHTPIVHAEDDFFALGGHSLRAVQLVARLRETFLVNLPLRRVFEQSTLAGLARTVESLTRESLDPDLEALLAEIENEAADNPLN